jgi:hypothetical protein
MNTITDIKEELFKRGFVSYGKRILSKHRHIEGYSSDDGSIVTYCKGINVSVWTVQIGMSGEIQSFLQSDNAISYIDRMLGRKDAMKILEARYEQLASKSRESEMLLQQKISLLNQQMVRLENTLSKLKIV